MNVLVLGGTGFLSSAVVGELRHAGHAVTILTRGQRPVPEGMRALTGDRRDPEALTRAVEGMPFDAVVDCICFTPRDVEGSLRAFGGRIALYVMISTDFVYGRERRQPMDEETPIDGLSEYGRNKAACEALFLERWAAERFPVTILRPPHILGAGSHLGSGSLEGRDPALLDRLARGGPVVLLDGGSLLIQPVYHRDVGRACAAVLGRDATLGQAYNAAGPDAVTTREYYDLIAGVIGAEAVEYLSLPSADYVAAFPDRGPFATHRTYSTAKLLRDTGYAPATSLQHALFETIDWLQASGAARPYEETERDAAVAALCRAFSQEAAKVLAE